LLAVLVLLGVVAAIGGSVMLVSARGALLSGQREVDLARRTLRLSMIEHDPANSADRARAALLRARADFRAAQNRLSYVAPIVTHLSWVPAVGGEIAGSPAAASLAAQTTDGALSLLDGLRPLLADFARRGRGSPVSVARVLREIAAGRASFVQACTDFEQADKTRRELSGYQSGAISSRLATVNRQLPSLRVACRALIALPELLGLNRPYTYLIAYQDPEELRPTGGFIGSAGLLKLSRGRASQQFVSTGIRDNLSVPPPDPLILYDHEPGWLFRDSNWSPDFPTTAALERFFARLDLGWDAPAVIDITPQAVADILGATGSFYAPEYHRWITAGNLARLTDYFTHRTRNFGPLAITNPELRRKQFISIVASHLFRRLTSLQPSALVRLVRAVGDDLARRNILVNFRDAGLQQLLRMSGATGEVRHDTSDFLYVVDSNLSYNKVNPYVHVTVDYTARILTNRWLQAAVTLHFRNVRAPKIVYADAYGPGAGTAGSPEDYSDFVRILVPAGAEILSQSGWDQPWTSGLAYGKTMLSGYLIVRVNTTREVRVSYIVPPNVFSWSSGREYRLVVQHQPSSVVSAFHLKVFADGKAIMSRAVRKPDSDWTITAPIDARSFSPIPLSRNAAPEVTPGHWIEPHAFLGSPKT
jgi:hypothetical protein